MDQLRNWQKIGRVLSILWILGAVVISTKTVGEDRLKFREEWYENCIISKENYTILKQKLKNQNKKNNECYTKARLESLKAIPDYFLIRKVGYLGILPVFIIWLFGFKIIKKSTIKD
jgi:hypothetical protein